MLQSLRRRYGLDVHSDFQDLTGRQQILRLHHNDEADFLLAPHAPFLLVADHGALNYRWMTPVHAYEQAVLRAPGTPRGRRRKLLIYKDGSPEEQLMAHAGIPASADPEIVVSLERLIAHVEELDPGDMVIAWEPLASGLESKHRLARFAEFKLWVSLYCHKRWQRGALRALKDQFSRLFSSEWIYCRKNREWALECLAVELKALEFFTAGVDWAAASLSAAVPPFSPSRQAITSSSPRTASSTVMTGRTSKTNAGSIEQNLWMVTGSSHSTSMCPPHSPTRITKNSILKLAGAFHWPKTSRMRFWAFSYSMGEPCGRSNQLSTYFMGNPLW